MDTIDDLHFAEPVWFYPMTSNSGGMGGGDATGEGGAQDQTRSILKTMGIYCVPGASATGEGGSQASGMAVKEVTSNEWVSITEANLGDPSVWQQGDRVFFPERNAFYVGRDGWHTISTITPSATGRFNVMLLRLKEGVGVTNQIMGT